MTRKGLLSGIVVAALAVALLPIAAWAQDKVSRPAPEELRVQDMTDAELHQRLAECESGKRDDRDAYIILNQLRFNLQAQQKSSSSEFQAISNKRDELLKKHPEFARLKDFRLSDRIRHQEKAAAAKAQLLQKAKNWTPSDSVPLRIIGSGKDAVAVYQFRLDFLRLGPEHELRPVPTAPTVLKLFRDGQEIAPKELVPQKTLTYQNRFEVLPRYPDQVENNFLICSDLIHAKYHAISKEERELTRTLGHGRVMPWKNKKGSAEQACSVLSVTGNTVFSFPITQRLPDRLAAGLGMTADGKKAAIMLGEKTELKNEYGTESVIGKPREVLVWEEGKELRRIPISNRSLTWNDLIQQFAQGRF